MHPGPKASIEELARWNDEWHKMWQRAMGIEVKEEGEKG
jgi:hypothetical protein